MQGIKAAKSVAPASTHFLTMGIDRDVCIGLSFAIFGARLRHLVHGTDETVHTSACRDSTTSFLEWRLAAVLTLKGEHPPRVLLRQLAHLIQHFDLIRRELHPRCRNVI